MRLAWKGMVLEMKEKKIFASLLALTVCMTSASAGASGLTVGYTEYSSNGSQVSGPVPGSVSAGITVTNDGQQDGSTQFITALYDDISGTLSKVYFSDIETIEQNNSKNVSVDMDIDTLDGYSMKHYIWDSVDGMKPIAPSQKSNLSLKAEYGYKRTVLTWSELSDYGDTASYSILKDGNIIAQNIPADRASYCIDGEESEEHTYRVIALNSKGVVTAISGEVTVVPENESNAVSYKFEADKMEHVLNSSPIKSMTYGSDDRQVTIGGGGTLHYDEESGEYKYNEELGDGNWGETEIGGRKAMFTTAYQSGGTTKNGCINVLLGNEFSPNDRIIRVTFDYYDNGTDVITVRYVSGPETGTFSTKAITKTGTDEWKTATIELENAYFNGENPTGLFSGPADFRFESNGSIFYIGDITVEKTNFYGAEFVIADDNTIEPASGENQFRYSDPQIKMGGNSEGLSKLDEPIFNGDKQVDYNYTGTGDAGYIYTEVGGKKAAMTAYYKRNREPGREFTEGFFYFSLGSGFKSTDKNITITLEYYDNSTSEIGVYYVNSANQWAQSVISRTGTNEWKTADFTLTNAYFNGAEATGLLDGKADFRIKGSNNAPIYIHSVKVYLTDAVNDAKNYEIKSQNADTLYPDGVSFEVSGEGYTGNGIEFVDNSSSQIYGNGDGYTVWENREDFDAVTTTSFGYGGSTGNNLNRNTFLYFTVDDEYMYGLRDGYAEFEIEYLDSADRDMILQYNKQGSPYQSYTILRQMGTNTWKTAKFIIKDASFIGAQNFGSDFRLTMNGLDENDQLTIKSLKIKNISHKQQKVSDGIPTVYIAGDSIAANYADDSEIIGWGMRLPQYITNGADVKNYAVAGASTKTFANFAAIENDLYKNDYVLISFGHNDSMTGEDRGVAVGIYKKNIKAYIADVLNKQAIPVVLSSIPTYDPDGTMDDGIEEYRIAAAEAAAEMNVPFIDLGGQFKTFLSGLAVEDALTYYVYENSDRRVHLSETGAQKVAEIIAQSLKENSKIRVLKNYMD